MRVSESEGVAAHCFQAPVDGFGGAVGGVVVEERQYVIAAAPQGTAELGDLLSSRKNTAADRVDQSGHRMFAVAPVGVCIGDDDLLADQRGELDGEVLLRIKNAGQPQVLADCEQLEAGAGNAPGIIECVVGRAGR